jgi:predicted RNA-binding protein YlqC (UPF0109 family)
MKELLNYILESLVGAGNFEIEEKKENGVTTYLIHASQEFMGRIIGKSGAVIKAISDIVRIKAKLLGETVYINALEK